MPRPARASTPGLRPLLALALLLLSWSACTPRDPAVRLPPGSWWQGEAASLDRLLADVETLRGTPAARQARAVRERIRGCSELFAHCPPEEAGCSLVGSLQCQPEGEPAARARRARGEDHWLLVTGGGSEDRVVARGSGSPDGGALLRLRLPRSLGAGAAGLFLPARGEAGAARLSDGEALLHSRVKADRGLGLAELVAAEGWADRLFGLRNELFLGTVLTGRWELAVYPPEPGQLIPPMALGLDVRNRQGAITAMESYLSEVMERWPVQRTPWALGDHPGACLSDLRLMPELAPCYVATADAVVLGWNAASVELALASPPPEAPGASSLRLFLDRLPAADQLLREAYEERLGARPGAAAGEAPTYPWRRLELHGERRGGVYLLELELTR